MYLKKLYQTNRWWFAIIMLFITAQLALNIRRDVSITPVYHYGMYSKVILPETRYSVTEITVNNRLLQAKDFTPWQWDRISQPAVLWSTQKEWNSYEWHTDISRLLHVKDSTKYINSLTQPGFDSWYKNYLQQMLGKKIDSVRIDVVDYSFDGEKLFKNPRTGSN
jgi:hypothetical protein